MNNRQDINAVLRSQEYFRLKTAIQSPGDIFELDESTRAVYIGPDSDIAEAQVTYFNPDNPNGTAIETAVVSVNGPFVGRLDSLPKTAVPSTGQSARILISPVDLVNNSYVSPVTAAQRKMNIPAILDVMCALKTLPDIPSVRADRTLRYPGVPYNMVGAPPANDGSTDLYIPIYGRRMVSICAVGNGIAVTLSLVNLVSGSNTVPRPLGSFYIPATIPATPQSYAAVFRASDAARHGINYDPAGVETGGYTESDQPGGSVLSPFLPIDAVQPRGMADLLVINLAQIAPVGVVNTLKFADFYIKLADRET
jgi:hypothetical protein